jgi:hypothetical protein
MAVNYADVFKSTIDVEEAIGEFRALLQSHIDVAGDALPPILFTFEKGLERLEAAFSIHQAKCHTCAAAAGPI